MDGLVVSKGELRRVIIGAIRAVTGIARCGETANLAGRSGGKRCRLCGLRRAYVDGGNG